MRILPINDYNYHNNKVNHKKNNVASFGANTPKILAMDITELSDKGKNVVNYLKQGCPKTIEGKKNFNKLFVPAIFDLYYECRSIESLLGRCGDNPELIYRALGKYGLELYGDLPQGSTVEKTHEGLVETGYWSKYDDLNTNFLNYLYYNPSGNLDELQERFGNHSPMWLTRHEATGLISTGLYSYNVIKDLADTSTIAVVAQTLRQNAIRKYIDRRHSNYCRRDANS